MATSPNTEAGIPAGAIVVTFRDGHARSIYNDKAVDLYARLGVATVTRASHVEPHAHGGWYADMRPSGGPVLFDDGPCDSPDCGQCLHVGFATRQAALDAEVAWLREHRGL